MAGRVGIERSFRVRTGANGLGFRFRQESALSRRMGGLPEDGRGSLQDALQLCPPGFHLSGVRSEEHLVGSVPSETPARPVVELSHSELEFGFGEGVVRLEKWTQLR